jgi:MFS family permease
VAERQSAWSPLRQPLFRRLWVAQLGSNVGTWIQSVAAVWLMLTLSSSSVLVALVQTASTLPIFLFGLPGGALADVLDRRRLLIGTEAWMVVCATALGVTAALDVVTPALLLGLTFGLGVGVALNQPAWQAIQPELVPEEELPEAVALGGVSINLGRAVGPAVGGALVVAAGPDVAFLVNAASYIGVLAVLVAWRRAARSAPRLGERVLDAVQAGMRYARYAPALRAVLVRTVLFAVPASVIFALLPIVARDELDLGAQGYGLLVGAFGVGAVGAAILLPRLRRRLPLDAIVAGATVALALVIICLAFVTLVGLVAAALVAGGLVWLLAISSMNVAAQFSVPAWVRGRGLSVYILLFSGSMAAGSAVWGVVAEAAGTEVALAVAAATLAAGTLATFSFPLAISERLDLRPALHQPEPAVLEDGVAVGGPVLVTVDYRVPLENGGEFAATMRRVERMRRRTGARRWGLYQVAADPEGFLETFVVDSWDEYRRQHDRVTRSDRMLENRRDGLLAPGSAPAITHYVSPYGRGGAVQPLDPSLGTTGDGPG